MGAIEPQFIASSAIPKRLPRQVMKSHVGDAASGLIPTTPEGVRVGHMALLPVFLAAVLVESGKGRLSGYVRQLLSEGTDKETWVLQHKKVGTLAVPLGFFFPKQARLGGRCCCNCVQVAGCHQKLAS